MKPIPLFCRLMAEATSALEDAAALAAELQNPRIGKFERQRMAAELEGLARDGTCLVRAAIRVAANTEEQ